MGPLACTSWTVAGKGRSRGAGDRALGAHTPRPEAAGFDPVRFETVRLNQRAIVVELLDSDLFFPGYPGVDDTYRKLPTIVRPDRVPPCRRVVRPSSR